MGIKKIKDADFLACEEMPYMPTYQDTMEWLTKSDFMFYVFGRVRKVLVFNNNTLSWQGINFGKSERVLLSKQKKIRRKTKVFLELLEREGLDKLPPVRSFSRLGDRENFRQEDIIKVLAGNQAVMKYFCISLVSQGVIIKSGRGWIGAEND